MFSQHERRLVSVYVPCARRVLPLGLTRVLLDTRVYAPGQLYARARARMPEIAGVWRAGVERLNTHGLGSRGLIRREQLLLCID